MCPTSVRLETAAAFTVTIVHNSAALSIKSGAHSTRPANCARAAKQAPADSCHRRLAPPPLPRRRCRAAGRLWLSISLPIILCCTSSCCAWCQLHRRNFAARGATEGRRGRQHHSVHGVEQRRGPGAGRIHVVHQLRLQSWKEKGLEQVGTASGVMDHTTQLSSQPSAIPATTPSHHSQPQTSRTSMPANEASASSCGTRPRSSRNGSVCQYLRGRWITPDAVVRQPGSVPGRECVVSTPGQTFMPASPGNVHRAGIKCSCATLVAHLWQPAVQRPRRSSPGVELVVDGTGKHNAGQV